MDQCPNSALPPQRLRPDTRPEHQDPVSYMAASAGGSPLWLTAGTRTVAAEVLRSSPWHEPSWSSPLAPPKSL